MPYKALSRSRRRLSATVGDDGRRSERPTPRRPRDWIALGIMVLLLPALILPGLVTNAAGASLSAEPSQAQPGGAVTIRGEGFPPKARGYLAFDGADGGPAFRVDSGGMFAAQLLVAADASEGPHVVSAMTQLLRHGGGSRVAAYAVAATLTILIVAPETGSPSAPPSVPGTITATPGPTSSPTSTMPSWGIFSWRPSMVL